MGATATRGYRCRCGSDQPTFVLSVVAHKDFGVVPVQAEFKLRMPVTDSGSSSGVIEETLCGYVVRNSMRCAWFVRDDYRYFPARYYRLVYRRGKNVNDGMLPAAARHHNDDDLVDREREERRLLATEEGRQRYGLGKNFNF